MKARVKLAYRSDSLGEVHHLKNLLEQEGIACIVKNELLRGGLGEIPFLECMPELWVLDDQQLPRALELIEQQREPSTRSPWRCPRCGEVNEGQFALCWNCGTPDERP